MMPPQARIDPVRDTLYGDIVDDPYRWLEESGSDEARAYVAAQGDYARATLDALPLRADLLARISTLSEDVSGEITSLQIVNGRYFYLRRQPQDLLPKLMVRPSLDSPERVLLDPETLGGEEHTAIDWYAPSVDGRLVAYGVSQGGSEDSALHLLAVEGEAPADPAISRVRFGLVSWLPDGDGFYYMRFAALPAGAPATDRYKDGAVHLHLLGADPEADPVVLSAALRPELGMAREDFPAVVLTTGSAWAVGAVLHGVLNEITLFAARIEELRHPGNCRWRPVTTTEDAVTGFAVSGDTIYLLSHKDAPRYRVLSTSLAEPDVRSAAEVVAQSGTVIREIKVAGDWLLLKETQDGLGRLRRLPLAGGSAEIVPLPVQGSIGDWAADTTSSRAAVAIESWIVAPRFYGFDAGEGTLRDSNWQAASPIAYAGVEVHEVHAPARDGTSIPLSIIHPRGMRLDGSNPTLLHGYGSYGISLFPYNAPRMLAWHEHGGVLAIAHVRGGGELGREWHEAGRKLAKERTISDFIDCAEYLIAAGYTRPDRLAGMGTSAGGIPTGGALVRRPDLWAAMIMRVALTNALRFERDPNGPPNVPEFGSVTTEEGYLGLRLIDAYARVEDGTPYPAVLLTTGLNDPRVPVWQASKMAARLQAATISGRSILLRVEAHGGHGLGSTRQQLDEEWADILAFLLWQCRLTY